MSFYNECILKLLATITIYGQQAQGWACARPEALTSPQFRPGSRFWKPKLTKARPDTSLHATTTANMWEYNLANKFVRKYACCINPLSDLAYANVFVQKLQPFAYAGYVCAWVLTCRDCHRYRKTHRFEVMGFAGTGMVVEFGTPWWWAHHHSTCLNQ